MFNKVRVRADACTHNAQLIPSVPTPPPGHLSSICHLVGPGCGALPGGGAFVNSSRRGNVVPFSILFFLTYEHLDSFRYFYK